MMSRSFFFFPYFLIFFFFWGFVPPQSTPMRCIGAFEHGKLTYNKVATLSLARFLHGKCGGKGNDGARVEFFFFGSYVGVKDDKEKKS